MAERTRDRLSPYDLRQMDSAGRRTKILATLGPASDNESTLRGMIAAGMDAVRLNLSHGTVEEALVVHRRVRALAKEAGRDIGTLVDLPGPKVRAASFGREGVELPDGHRVRLTSGNTKSTREMIEVDYAGLLGRDRDRRPHQLRRRCHRHRGGRHDR